MSAPHSFRASARLIDFMRQADEPSLINLAAGVPGLDALPTEALSLAMTRAMEKEGARIFAYHHPEGDHELRELLAQRLNARGVDGLSGSQLFTTTGCTQALAVMLSVILAPGDLVAVEAPAYYGMLEILSEAGARVLPLPVIGGEGIDPAQAEELFTRFKPRCLVICSSLSNPSGATLPVPAREKLVEICRRLGVRIIEDDIYAELVDGGAPTPMRAFDDGSTVSYVSSFSKSISPGLRVGLCVPGDLFDSASARKCQRDLHSAVPTEMALREFMAAGALEPHLAMLRTRNARRRGLALAAIARAFPSGTRVSPPLGGYMLWAELPEAVDLARVRGAAREKGVAFAAGTVFFTQTAAKSCVRLNCAKASEEDLVRGIEVLGGCF